MKNKCKGCNTKFYNLKEDSFCHVSCEKEYKSLYKPCPVCNEKDIRVNKKACSKCNAKVKAQKNNWDKSSRKCHVCDKLYKPLRSTNKTCSKKCSKSYIKTRNLKPKVNVSCVVCGSSFNKAKGSAHITCSKKCSNDRCKIKNAERALANKPPKKPLVEKDCVSCGVSFKQTNSRQRKCNPKCRPISLPKPCKCGSKLVKSPKLYCDLCHPRTKPKEELERSCDTCGSTYITKNKASKYCKRNCQPSRKARKKAQKLKCKQAKPQSVSWNDIQSVYDNCPEGMEVDHIIPRNHSKVCGLHVPWNLQYLSPEENLEKSNKFPYKK